MSQEPTRTTANLRSSGREAHLCALLSRRLRSARGTAYLEFAVLVPFFLFAFLFAADFTRVLYAEQQVEIATRALCDIEAHLVPGARDRNGVVGSGCPGWQGKGIVRQYVAEALAKEGIDGQFWDPKSSVYCKGSFSTQEGFAHTVVNKLVDILKGQTGAGKFIDIMAKILGGVVDVLTLRTFRYLSEVFPTDRVVKTTVSVYVRPFSPHAAYTLFGRHGRDGVMLVPTAAPRQAPGYYDRALVNDQRVRYYCHMPSMDTAALAPPTLVRKLTKVFSTWIK